MEEYALEVYLEVYQEVCKFLSSITVQDRLFHAYLTKK